MYVSKIPSKEPGKFSKCLLSEELNEALESIWVDSRRQVSRVT